MNLIDFHVTEIISEEHDKVWKLYGMSESELEKEKNWSKQSIISFLKRMEQKGTVTYVMQGRTKFYSAIAKKEDIVRKETKGILNRFFDGKLGSMVSYMAKETKITGEDIQELKQLLEKLEEENRD